MARIGFEHLFISDMHVIVKCMAHIASSLTERHLSTSRAPIHVFEDK